MLRDILLYSMIGSAIYLVATFLAGLQRKARGRGSQQGRRPF